MVKKGKARYFRSFKGCLHNELEIWGRSVNEVYVYVPWALELTDFDI